MGRSMVDDHVLAVLAALAAMASILRWMRGGSNISAEVTAAACAASAAGGGVAQSLQLLMKGDRGGVGAGAGADDGRCGSCFWAAVPSYSCVWYM